MNLNQYDRNAFVKSVMDDVPLIDYNEMAQKKAKDYLLSLLPKDVIAIYKKYPVLLASNSFALPGRLRNVCAPMLDYDYRALSKNNDLWLELTELAKQYDAQTDKRYELESQLKTTIATCRTLKQAQERLPEFAKYLPKDRGATGVSNLPVANLVKNLTEAGWPKSDKKQTSKKGA